MLSKKYRLPVQKFIRSRSRVFRGDYFIIRVKPNNLPFSRFGAVISRRVNKAAARRNKIKRSIFDFIRLKEYHLKAGKDILIIISPQVGKLTKAETESEIENILNFQFPTQ